MKYQLLGTPGVFRVFILQISYLLPNSLPAGFPESGRERIRKRKKPSEQSDVGFYFAETYIYFWLFVKLSRPAT